MRTIDSIIADLGIPSVDILKLDVQGAEARVLEGARKACAAKKIGLIYTEIIIQPTYIGQRRFDSLFSSYFNAGFDLYYIYNLTASKSGKLCQIDALFAMT